MRREDLAAIGGRGGRLADEVLGRLLVSDFRHQVGDIVAEEYLRKILTARVYDVAVQTPLHEMRLLSDRLDNQVLLKREDLQPVFSFKLRGAYNKMVQASPEARAAGFVTASAGNHAQGVALAASRLGSKSLIVMPRTTPGIKVQAVRALGGKTVLHGDTYDEAYEHALSLAAEKGMTFVHPYDDPEVIAGQGTVGMEILRQSTARPPHAIFVPVGGGGLIAGVAVYVKTIMPQVRIIGVEPHDAPTLARALEHGRRVKLESVGIFVDGVAVRQIGAEPFRLCRRYVDEVVEVGTDEVCAAIKDIFDDTRSIAEPSGALGVAGVKKYVERMRLSGEILVAIDSGANINFDRLRHVAERAEIGERREILLAVTIPERPGSFREFCRTIGKKSVTEFNYRYADQDEARVFVGIKVDDAAAEKGPIIEQLTANGYPVVDMSDNEMAKIHVRYMVGGHGPKLANERIFRFRFPERPGALLNFLNHMGEGWNISMFHYRNHGAAYGRVLAGLQVPQHDERALRAFLTNLGYAHSEETDNPAYALFLR